MSSVMRYWLIFWRRWKPIITSRLSCTSVELEWHEQTVSAVELRVLRKFRHVILLLRAAHEARENLL